MGIGKGTLTTAPPNLVVSLLFNARSRAIHADDGHASVGGSDARGDYEPRVPQTSIAEIGMEAIGGAARRRSSAEASEELFPGFVEEKRGSASGGGQKSGGTFPGGLAGRLSDSHGLADSGSFNNNSSSNNNNKPLRRAQIFDKGVDASMMQVGA